MKRLVFAAVAAIVCACAQADLITDYAGLSAAIDAAGDGATIKLKAGTIAFSAPLAVSKGITLSGGWTDESTRADGAMTTFDGENASNLLVLNNGADTEFVAERLVLTRGQQRAVEKKNSGNVTFRDCRIESNGTTTAANVNGRGMSLTGVGATVAIVNCEFRGNLPKNERMENFVSGGAIYATSLGRLTVDDSLFVTNGIPFGYVGTYVGPHFNGVRGAAIYAQSAPLTARNCRFIGNRSIIPC